MNNFSSEEIALVLVVIATIILWVNVGYQLYQLVKFVQYLKKTEKNENEDNS